MLAQAVILTGFGGLLLVGGWAAHGLWRAVMREDRPVLLHRMLERQGLSTDRLVYATDIEQTGAAVRRCVMCRDREECLAWLDRGGRAGYERFCPNADFIARLRTAAAA
jgi:hypothetical protein